MVFAILNLFSLMTCVWLFSVMIKDASIVDRVWGIAFIVQAVTLAMLFPSDHSKLLAILCCLWGLRLSVYIHFRNRNKPEDFRYQAMRERHGRNFWWYSLFSVFWLQGVISLTIAAPFYSVALSTPVPLGVFSCLGLGVWVIGFYFEAMADWQLSRFKKDPANHGKIMQQGVWRQSRHPNYFGDACQFWGLYIIASETEYGLYSFFGPAFLTFLLLKVSGVALLESSLSSKKPGYDTYVASTPAFVPRMFNLFYWFK